MAIHACSEAVVKIEHFILTRFNVTSQFTENVPQIDIHSDEYLEKRISLFRKFCFPSVSRQTGDFKWLVFFSKYTPDRFKEEIETLRRNYMFFCPMYIDDKAIEPKMTKVVMHRMLMETYSPDSEVIITTRIDNDDAINVDYVSWIRETTWRLLSENEGIPFIITCPNGYLYNVAANTVHKRYCEPNHFLSFVENPKDMRSVFGFRHTLIDEQGMLVAVVENKFAWLEVVHDTNVINSTRHTLKCNVSVDELNRQYGTLI